jgi:hypothetical protein
VLDASRPASGESTLDTINRTTDGTQTERQIPAGATPDTTGMRKSAARDAVAADQGESAKVGYGIDPDKLVTPESTAYTDMAAGRAPVVDPKIPYTHEELVGFGREEDPNAIDHTDHAEVERQKDAMANEGGPNFKRAAREDGETDKQYAKRVIDKGPMPEGKLKDDPNLYFNKGDLVDLDKLHATKPPEDNTDNAIKRMAAASEGALSKRDPISIAPRPGDPGNFDVVDGNGTLSAAKAAGFKQLPTKIDTRSEEMAEQISNGKKVSLEEANEVNPRLASSLESLRTRMQQASKVKEKFDTAVERISDMVGGTTQLAPIKGEARAFAKTWYDNRGDASVIKDLVRGTVVVHTPDAVKEVVSEIKRQFPDTVVKRNTYETEPKEDGYRDALLYVDIGGMKCELQVNIPEMMAAKKENHGLYEQVSALDRKYSDKMMPAAERSRRGDMIAAQRQSYDAAYALALRARSESTSLAKSSKDSSVVVTDRNVSYRKGAGSPDGESQRAGLKSGPDSRIPNLGSQETGTSSQSKNSVVGEKSERLTDTGASPVNTEQDHSTTLFKRNGRDDAQMAWEATPGESTGVLPGIHDAPIEQKMEYLRAVSEALTDKKGNDLIAKALGVPEGETLFGVSAWDGRTGAGARTNLPVGVLKSGKVAKSARDMLNAYSAMRGIAMRQEAVVWHKPMYDSSLRAANGVDINLPRALTEPEFTALYKGLIDRFGTSEIAPGYTGKGAVLLNFTDIPNPEFHAGVKDVLDKLPDEWGGGPYELKKFRSDGDYISNDWKENPNGEGFRSWLGGTERPDLWARATSLQARVDAVNGEFGSKYGWDKPAQAESAGSDASARATGAEKPVQGEQESGVVPEARFSRQLIEDTIEGKQKGPIAFLDSTPDKLKKAGLPDLPIAATAQVIQKIASGKNGARAALSSHDIFDLQNHLKNPLAVFKSDSVKGDFVVLTKMIKDGKPVAVTLTPDGRMMSARINVLTSAYGKDAGSISDWVKKGNMVSVDRRGFEDLPVPVQAQLRSMVDDAAPRFSRDKDTIGERFTLGGQSNKDGAQTALQDRFLRMKQVQDDVEAQGGKVDHMTGNDVYRTEERYHGTVAAKVGDFSKYTVQPLVRDMAKAGVSMDDVALYMYAKHAEERNDRIADINPMMPDGGSGMTTEEANKILADYATDPKIDAIRDFADRFQAITEATRQELVKGGLVDPETLAKWNQSYKNYVPLKGFENVDELGNLTRNNAGGRGSGKGFSIDGDESRRALGRSTKAGDILENIINDHERAIQRSEKNKVAKALLDFVTDNPDKKLWQVNRVVSKPYFLKSRLPPTPGQLMDGQVAYRKETVKDPERTVTAKVGGKEYHITLGDQKLADAFLKQRGVLNMDSQEVAKAMKVWVGVNRGLARLYTSLNPAFVMTNFLKHYTVGMLHGSTAMGPKLGLQIGRDTFPAAAGIFAEERGAQPSVVPATGPKTWGQWYQQYKADGGRTGFYIFDDIDAKKERLNGLYREAGGSGMSTPLSTIGAHGFAAVHALSHLVEDANGSVENAVRLAAYKNAVEGGMSRAEASSMAKNLVANFNRRGTWTPVVGSAFLFFNPAVQHITRIGQAARESPKTWTSLVASMVGAGIYLGLRNAQDTDEDGVPYWDKDVSSYEKEKNFVISLGGGKRVTIPTPYEYGAFVHMGYAISDMMRGHSLSDKTAEIAGSFLEHFNPINSGSTGITRLVPSAFAPIAQYAANQNYQGNPLMPDAGPNNLPDSERYWGSTRGSLVQEFTSWLNSVTGGDKAVPGKISVSPEVVKNTLAGYTGGMGTFVANTMETLSTLMGGQGLSAAIDKGQVPFAAQVLKTDTLHGEEQYFRVASGQAERSLAEMKQYYNSDNPAILDRIQKNNGIAALANSVAEVNRAMGSLRKQDNMIVDDPDMSQSEKDAAHKEIDAQRQQLLSTWNNQFYRAQQEKEQQ